MVDTIKHISKWIAVFFITLLLLLPACLLGLLNKKLGAYLLKCWGKSSLFIFSIRVQVDDHNNSKYKNPPYLLIHLNQTSLSETFIMAAHAPVPFITISNIEYAMIPFVGWIQLVLGGFILIRQNKEQAKRAIERAKRAIRLKKINMMISIEGKRSEDGKLQPFKKGPIVLALDNHTPIIPFAFIGAKECLAYGEWKVKPGIVKLIFEKRIDTSIYTINDRDILIHTLQQIAKNRLETYSTCHKNLSLFHSKKTINSI